MRHLLLLLLLLTLWGCDDSGTQDNTTQGNNTQGNTINNTSSAENNLITTCDGMTETDCVEIHIGERVYPLRLGSFTPFAYDDEGESKMVVTLSDLIIEEATETPQNFRYQIWGTDGYTFGGYATYTNMQNGYIEVATRRVIFDPAQELPNSYNVKDTYKITLSPAK